MAQSKSTLVRGARVVDPASNVDGRFDLLVERGKISALEKPGVLDSVEGADVVAADGLLLVPGLVDLHVHLREPGFEWKETVETGSVAAAAGGYTALCCMPNTNPPNDCAQVTQYIRDAAQRSGAARVFPIGAITKGQHGESLAPLLELREAGCVAFSDDGYPVSNSAIMRKALEYSLMLDAPLACHEEDRCLSEGFAMNESALSIRLGLKGMPGAAEDVMIARDIELARLTGARVHFCHVSTARGALLIQRAKEDGISVTAECTAHHFTLDETAVAEFDANAKMNPPLRSRADAEALLAALRSGVIDCIASDHAPHEADSKNVEFALAANGIIGLQTTLPLTLAKVREGALSLSRAIEVMTSSAAKCFNLPVGTLRKGAEADFVLIDPEREVVFSKDEVRSKSKNSPFLDWTLKGVAVRTYLGGREVYNIGAA